MYKAMKPRKVGTSTAISEEGKNFENNFNIINKDIKKAF